jgi:hypothetical protein
MKITQAVKLLETFGWLTFKDDVGGGNQVFFDSRVRPSWVID